METVTQDNVRKDDSNNTLNAKDSKTDKTILPVINQKIEHPEFNTNVKTQKILLQKHLSLLQMLSDKNKIKIEEKKIKAIKSDKIKEKYRENLGLTRVKSKLLENPLRLDNNIIPLLENIPRRLSAKNNKGKKNKKTKFKKEDKFNKIEPNTVPMIREKSSKKLETSNKSNLVLPNLKNCNSLEDWKRRNRVDTDKKVFICFNGYPDMKKALLTRGWVENMDPESQFFDFKCILSGRNLSYDKLLKAQKVNHFEHNGELTRKGSLCKNLKNLIWFRNINVDLFYPRSYSLNETNDLDSFILNYKMTKAESILKDYLSDNRTIMDKILVTSMKICERMLKGIDEIIDSKVDNLSISAKEWDIICEDAVETSEDKHNEKKRSKSSSLKLRSTINTNSIYNDIKGNATNLLVQNRVVKEKVQNNDAYKEKVKEILEQMSNKELQFSLNGSRNIWIMKPSGLSRGRGIKCISSLSEVLLQIKSGCNQYVIQKYIENPLIIHNKKFDIRQWVLVTNFNPLTIWIYEEPYLRFTAEDYNPDNIGNLFSHLTNNAIAVKSKKFDSSEIQENMWDTKTFTEYLKTIYKEDIYETKIKKKIKEIIIYTLESVQDVIVNRKNSHEVFGFDLMIDDKFNVWLIEVNSSPCMDYSTQITKRLVKLLMDDLCKVLIDSKSDKNADTGLWKLIHKGKYIEETTVPVGFNLVCEGVKFNPSEEKLN